MLYLSTYLAHLQVHHSTPIRLRNNKEEGDSITDLVLLVLRILRRDLSELAGSIKLVDLYNKG